jgi:hypothetical protein
VPTTHILSLTRARQQADLNLSQSISTGHLRPAELEGDFSQYFRLYVDESDQTNLRQVLDPAIMAYLIDYCKEYDWELTGRQLIILQPDKIQTNSDGTGLIEDATIFATKILPSLLRMANDEPMRQA